MNKAKAELVRRLYRAQFPAFVRFAFHEAHPGEELVDNWHLDVKARALSETLAGGSKRLIINAPPRSLKSFITSIAFPAFALGRDPTCKILCLAGSPNLAGDLHVKTKKLMRSDRYRALFPHIRFDPERPEIRLPQGGQLIPGVIGQSLIGRGADIIIVDDPLPVAAARDDKRRTAVNSYFDSDVMTRLNDKANGVVIVVMQRLHPDDLTGHLRGPSEIWSGVSQLQPLHWQELATSPWRREPVWRVIRLSAIALADETWRLPSGRLHRRQAGEALIPAREDVADLKAIFEQGRATNFAAQYLQQPYIPQTKNEHQVGWFSERIEPATWTPEMECSKGEFYRIADKTFLRRSLFGDGRPGLHRGPDPGMTDEMWQAAARHQQGRLTQEVALTEQHARIRNMDPLVIDPYQGALPEEADSPEAEQAENSEDEMRASELPWFRDRDVGGC